jgi:hypothetical protein
MTFGVPGPQVTRHVSVSFGFVWLWQGCYVCANFANKHAWIGMQGRAVATFNIDMLTKGLQERDTELTSAVRHAGLAEMLAHSRRSVLFTTIICTQLWKYWFLFPWGFLYDVRGEFSDKVSGPTAAPETSSENSLHTHRAKDQKSVLIAPWKFKIKLSKCFPFISELPRCRKFNIAHETAVSLNSQTYTVLQQTQK